LPRAVIGDGCFSVRVKPLWPARTGPLPSACKGSSWSMPPSSSAAASPWLASSWCSPRPTWPCASGRGNSGIRRRCGSGGLARLTAAAHTGRRGPYRPPAIPRSGAGRPPAPSAAAASDRTRAGDPPAPARRQREGHRRHPRPGNTARTGGKPAGPPARPITDRWEPADARTPGEGRHRGLPVSPRSRGRSSGDPA
jgi:hypothetical protein